MAYLIFIIISLGLLVGFFALTIYEGRNGVRLFSQKRIYLDQKVARIESVLARVDLIVFARNEILRVASRIGHDIVHISLQAVRIAERLLTRLIRHLRTRYAVDTEPRESTRPFVKTLSDFKGRLKATRSDAPDIQ